MLLSMIKFLRKTKMDITPIKTMAALVSQRKIDFVKESGLGGLKDFLKVRSVSGFFVGRSVNDFRLRLHFLENKFSNRNGRGCCYE